MEEKNSATYIFSNGSAKLKILGELRTDFKMHRVDPYLLNNEAVFL